MRFVNSTFEKKIILIKKKNNKIKNKKLLKNILLLFG